MPHQRVTTSGSPVAFGEYAGATSASQLAAQACSWVKFKAEYNNAGRVYLSAASTVAKASGTNTTTTGWQLSAGEETPWIPAANVNQFWRICDNAGDALVFMALS